MLVIAEAAIGAADAAVATRASAAHADIDTTGRTFLLAAMAEAFLAARPGLVEDGLVVGSHLPGPPPSPLRWQHADHPVPGSRSIDAGRAAISLARSIGTGDTLVVLVSGGASALLTVPVAGITLDDKQQVTRRELVNTEEARQRRDLKPRWCV